MLPGRETGGKRIKFNTVSPFIPPSTEHYYRPPLSSRFDENDASYIREKVSSISIHEYYSPYLCGLATIALITGDPILSQNKSVQD